MRLAKDTAKSAIRKAWWWVECRTHKTVAAIEPSSQAPMVFSIGICGKLANGSAAAVVPFVPEDIATV